MRKVLLTTVCGPFGADTDDCTRHISTTTIAVVLLNNKGSVLFRDYQFNNGNVYAALEAIPYLSAKGQGRL